MWNVHIGELLNQANMVLVIIHKTIVSKIQKKISTWTFQHLKKYRKERLKF